MNIRRRDFITLLGSATVASPLAARAQQADRMRRIGVLMTAYTPTDREGQARAAAFLDTFQKLGWSDGRNVRIDYRWDAGDTCAWRIAKSSPEADRLGQSCETPTSCYRLYP